MPLLPASLQAEPLQTIADCRFVPTDWADGDSFRVRFPDGNEHTVRLYGADCLEWHVTDTTDARRLRAQRRYFGISEAGGGARASIALAKGFGEASAKAVADLLAEPFTVHTAFADGGGDGKFKRVYAFVTTAEGDDLASVLVARGLARAYGVYRGTPDGRTHEDYRASLQDLELQAAKRGTGVWAKTDWDTLPDERRSQREEEAEDEIAKGKGPLAPDRKIDPNTAARDVLMQLPGIGETLANRIIEGRPYRQVEDLRRVPGIGEKTLERIKPFLAVP